MTLGIWGTCSRIGIGPRSGGLPECTAGSRGSCVSMKRSRAISLIAAWLGLVGACSAFDQGPYVGPDSAAAGGTATNAVSSGGGGGCVPDNGCKPTPPNTGDPYADCVARINQFRACVCLAPLTRHNAGEACADQEAQYDSQTGTAHSGFTGGICSPSGMAQNECPGYRSLAETISLCMQMMFDEGPPPAGACAGTCFQTYGHYLNFTDTRFSGVACGFYTTPEGTVWQVENFFP
jgi:hypothetical protein